LTIVVNGAYEHRSAQDSEALPAPLVRHGRSRQVMNEVREFDVRT
jgi:hypothetical protein